KIAMLFTYKAVDGAGANKEGEIDAASKDIAISALQRRGLVVVKIVEVAKKGSLLNLSFFDRISMKDIVVLSRQISTLFEAQVSALKAFNLLAENTDNKLLGQKLVELRDDIQAGVSISGAMARHPEVFS